MFHSFASCIDDDDLHCLRMLRDSVLGAVKRIDGNRSISHNALVKILGTIRDQAVNKATWNDAIRSTDGQSMPPSKSRCLVHIERLNF